MKRTAGVCIPKSIRKAVMILFWLLLWQGASLLADQSIIFVGPISTAAALKSLIFTADFWKIILFSFNRICLGFLAAFLFGILSGCLSFRFSYLKEILEPAILLMKSVPVASFIIIALIWAGSGNLATLVSFLIVFPVIYINVIAGLDNTDPELVEMAYVFKLSAWKKAYYIYQPAVLPYLVSGCKAALGMSWKSGIAAEVIGVPRFSIGEQLYMSKIYLDTASLFAWTFVIILISNLFERLFLLLLNRLAHH